MRSLPVSNEPYETSTPKELGEESSPLPDTLSHLCWFTSTPPLFPARRRVLRGSAGASDGATEDGGQEARGGRWLCGWRAGRRPAARVEGKAAELSLMFCQLQGLFGYFKDIVGLLATGSDYVNIFCALNLKISIYIMCIYLYIYSKYMLIYL